MPLSVLLGVRAIFVRVSATTMQDRQPIPRRPAQTNSRAAARLGSGQVRRRWAIRRGLQAKDALAIGITSSAHAPDREILFVHLCAAFHGLSGGWGEPSVRRLGLWPPAAG